MVVLIVLMIHISTGNAPHFRVLYNIGNTICTNGNANGTIGSPNGTIGTIGKPKVPLATNDTIGKIYQWYHWENPKQSHNKHVGSNWGWLNLARVTCSM